MTSIMHDIHIPLFEIEFSFVRSSGAGGQNVNKVSSKAILRWNPSKSTSISADILARFVERFKTRLTNDGDLIITSEKFRDQIRNREDCLNKLRAMLLSVTAPPKHRIKTKISYSKKIKGVEAKRTHGEKKKLRKRPNLKESFND